MQQDLQLLTMHPGLLAIHAARGGQATNDSAVAAVFAPHDPASMYPQDPPYQTYVELERIDEDSVEGSARPGFFRGVATVCCKLFNLTQPDHVFFGQKDGVQCIVINQLVRDLNFPCSVHVVPTSRDPDGLAMSSRNAYLVEHERTIAPVVYKSLQAAAALLPSVSAGTEAGAVSASTGVGETVSVGTLKQAAVSTINEVPGADLEYISIADNMTGQELADDEQLSADFINRRGLLLSNAVCVGTTRLIDNLCIPAASSSE
jgi:pantoate--beta-alanine ligase